MQAHGHDLPACPESGIPEGGALPQPVPEASQSPAAQVSITSYSTLTALWFSSGTLLYLIIWPTLRSSEMTLYFFLDLNELAGTYVERL